MRLLVLGGTRFLGRHAVEAALARGHQVTLFHRGRLARGLFRGAREVIGDRDGGLDALGDASWDAVLDLCGYVPRVVRQSAEALRGRTQRYLFVSTISVYDDPIQAGYDEDAPLRALADPTTEVVDGDTYGGLKVACERVVREVFAEGAMVVRPGVVVGPHDYMDRFAYWVRRLAEGGDVLAPGDPEAPVTWIDARDLAAFFISRLEDGETGTWHATGPTKPCTMREMFEGIAMALGVSPRLAWVEEAFLLANGVQPWSELPMWLAAHEAALHAPDLRHAHAAGLRTRPLADTARDTLAYERSLGPEARATSPAMQREREAGLLAAWRASAEG